jgi:hypothetical protein
MSTERVIPLQQRDEEQLRLSPDEVDQEFYTALRAAGASPEEAQSCLQAGLPTAAR